MDSKEKLKEKPQEEETPLAPNSAEANETKETPAEEQEASMSAEEQASMKKDAEALMKQHDVEEVFYVGGYWFTQKSYAEEYGKKVNEKIKTFTK